MQEGIVNRVANSKQSNIQQIVESSDFPEVLSEPRFIASTPRVLLFSEDTEIYSLSLAHRNFRDVL